MRARAAVACALAGLALAACRSAGGVRWTPPFHAEHDEEETGWAPWSSEWLGVSLAIVERQKNETVDLEDSYGWSIEGGLEFTRWPIRPSLELGAGWSPHGLEGVAGSEELDIFRVFMGGRLSWRSEHSYLSPYVRGGIFSRRSRAEDLGGGMIVDQDGSGTYTGAGIDVWTSPGGRAGPFVLWFEGNDEDELEELLIGFTFSRHF